MAEAATFGSSIVGAKFYSPDDLHLWAVSRNSYRLTLGSCKSPGCADREVVPHDGWSLPRVAPARGSLPLDRNSRAPGKRVEGKGHRGDELRRPCDGCDAPTSSRHLCESRLPVIDRLC